MKTAMTLLVVSLAVPAAMTVGACRARCRSR